MVGEAGIVRSGPKMQRSSKSNSRRFRSFSMSWRMIILVFKQVRTVPLVFHWKITPSLRTGWNKPERYGMDRGLEMNAKNLMQINQPQPTSQPATVGRNQQCLGTDPTSVGPRGLGR